VSESDAPAIRGSGFVSDVARLLKEKRRWKAAGKRLVLTHGAFDLLHPGHVALLEAARRQGDVLIVAINSDRSLRERKGAGRPLTPEAERGEILLALEPVDGVVVYDDPTPRELIATLEPDVLVEGADGPADQIVADLVEASGGRLVRVELVPGRSTAELVNRIRSL